MNDASFFLSHRLPIAFAAINRGSNVALAAPQSNHRKALEDLGIRYFSIPLTRRSATPWTEARTLFSLVRLLRAYRPSIVHAVTIKPVIYAGIASRLVGVDLFIGAISGLGHVFLATGVLASIRRLLVSIAYKAAFRSPQALALFQNPDDRNTFIRTGIVSANKTALIRGSGVDPSLFDAGPPPSGRPIVMLPARLLREKGVPEFIEAAAILRSRGVSARFVLVGKPDYGNPSSLTEQELSRAVTQGIVEWWGHRDDMVSTLQEASIVCLPSHGEGLPRVLLEAASCRRPIVATDVPGCKEVVRPGVNGLLVPVRSPEALADAIADLLSSPERAAEFGDNGRRIVMSEFSLDKVIRSTLRLYNIQ